MKTEWHFLIRKLLFIPFIICVIPTQIYAQQKPVVKIGVLVDLFTAESEMLRDNLQNEILAVVGEDATVEFPEANILINFLDHETAERNYQTLLENDTDIILAFGPLNSKIISAKNDFPKPVILFGAVNIDLYDFDVTRSTSGIANFNYLITSQSYTEDLNTFKSLYNFNRLGVLITEELIDIISIDELLDEISSQQGFEYTVIPYKDPESLEPYKDRVDAIYLAEGFFLDATEIENLARALLEWEVPSFTATFREDVERGLMATLQADENLDLFFRRIALNVEAVVNGANLADLPLFLETEPFLTVNFNTAEKVGVPIKYSFLATTQFVGDFKNVISEKTYSLTDVMGDVLERNLLLAVSERDVELSEQDVRTAQSNYLPDISASATGTYIDEETAELSNGQNPEYSTDGNITLTQTIFSEAANANISIQKNLYSAQQENFRATELDLIFKRGNRVF